MGVTFHDVTPPKEEVTVKPIEEQGEWESRKLWAVVAKGIREGDFETASKDKSRIEVFSLHFANNCSHKGLMVFNLLLPIERSAPETKVRGSSCDTLGAEAFQAYR